MVTSVELIHPNYKLKAIFIIDLYNDFGLNPLDVCVILSIMH